MKTGITLAPSFINSSLRFAVLDITEMQPDAANFTFLFASSLFPDRLPRLSVYLACTTTLAAPHLPPFLLSHNGTLKLLSHQPAPGRTPTNHSVTSGIDWTLH